jgi:hypothetical protein
VSNSALQSGLNWQQARALAKQGQLVRRSLWSDWLMYQGGVWFISPDGTFSAATKVVRNYQFGRAEFLAQDWTNVAPDQNTCVGLPGLTATLTLSSSTVSDGGTVTATLTIPEAQIADTVFVVSAVAALGAALSLPAAATIPEAETSVTFSITAPGVGTAADAWTIGASNRFFGVAQAGLASSFVAAPQPVTLPLSHSENIHSPAVGPFEQ